MKRKARIKLVLLPMVTIIAILIIPFFIDVWVENSNESQNLYSYTWDSLNKEIKLIYIIPFLISLVYYLGYLFINYNNEVEEFDRKSKDQAAILLSKNASLRTYELQKTINAKLESFVRNEVSVLAAQLYKYEAKIKGDEVKFKVTYYDGYVEEDININSLLQHYFAIDLNLYVSFSNTIELFKRDNENEEIMDFIENQVMYLNKKNSRSINKKDILVYTTLIDAYVILNTVYEDLDDIISIDASKINKLEKFVSEYKRLSIFRGILVNNFYMSSYQGNGEKQGRIYATMPIEINNDTMLLLIALEGAFIKDSSIAEKLIEKLTIEIKSAGQQNIVNEYNPDIIIQIEELLNNHKKNGNTLH